MSVGSRLSYLLSEEISRWEIPVELVRGVQETQVTATALLPKLTAFVQSLRRSTLVVRGDGGVPSLPAQVGAFSFYPDIEITEFSTKYIGLEVKLLRSNDPGGAFAKALGQSVIYRAFGFEFAHLVLIDEREISQSDRRLPDQFVDGLPEWLVLHHFTRVGNLFREEGI